MLATLDDLLQTFVSPLNNMGLLVGTTIQSPIAQMNNMPLSTAALAGFLMPWVDELGDILQAVATFVHAL